MYYKEPKDLEYTSNTVGSFVVSASEHKLFFPDASLGNLHHIEWTYFKSSDYLSVEVTLKPIGKILCIGIGFIPSIFTIGYRKTIKDCKSIMSYSNSSNFCDVSDYKELKEYIDERLK